MSRVNITLPESVKEYVDRRVGAGGFRDRDEYILSLIEADRNRKVRDDLEAQLLEGLNTPAEPMTRSDWDEIRRLGRERLARKTGT